MEENIIDSILRIAKNNLNKIQLPAGQADELAEAIALEVQFEWDGMQPYIPRHTEFKKEQIIKKFNGRNTRELAREFHVTERQINHIINQANQKNKLEQGTLF